MRESLTTVETPVGVRSERGRDRRAAIGVVPLAESSTNQNAPFRLGSRDGDPTRARASAGTRGVKRRETGSPRPAVCEEEKERARAQPDANDESASPLARGPRPSASCDTSRPPRARRPSRGSTAPRPSARHPRNGLSVSTTKSRTPARPKRLAASTASSRSAAFEGTYASGGHRSLDV